MRKITPLLSMALMALVLVPQTMQAECTSQFTGDAFPGLSADRTATDVAVTVKVGEGGMAQTDHTISNLTSSNPDKVVAYTERGNGVFFLATGTTVVEYDESVPRQDECSWHHIIHYIVEKGVPTAYFRGLDGSPATELTVAYTENAGGEGVETGGVGAGGGGTYVPSPLMQYKQYSNGHFANVNIPTDQVIFQTNNPAVATISEAGVITVHGTGTANLAAAWPTQTNWEGFNISLALTVKKDPNLYFSPSNITDSVGKVIPLNVVCPAGVSVTSWSSSNANIASVDDQGHVTLKLPGSAYIYANFAGNDEYAPGQCACMVTVKKARPHITFTPEVIRLEKDVDVFEAPVMNKPADLTETYNTTYEWSSYDPNGVASVNAQTGAVTLLGGTGTATIIYVFKGDVRYEAENARYYITVTTSGITVAGTYVTSANNGDVFGNGSVIYRYEQASGDKYLELNAPEFNAGGEVFIQSDVFLKILVKQNCKIKNYATGIACGSAVFIWCENRKDTITIDASNVAIQAQEMKIHDCYLFANGGQYGLFNSGGSMTVSAGGYVFASGTKEAIHARIFTKGEDNIGGIEILTKGVEFVGWQDAKDNFGGFYTDYENDTKATFVELGKVPLPVKTDEVTDINFDSENPDENLDVVFSESEDDTFNEEDKQIELNTITSAEVVDGALELYITCSSSWLKALPGVLVFDIPAGKGEMEIQCQLKEGNQLKVLIEGKGSATITQTSMGWAKLEYDVVEQTHVIVYLQAAEEPKPSPKRATKAAKDDTPGAVIKAIKITPSAVSTGIDDVQSDNVQSTKVLRDAQLLIIRGDKTYTVTGQRVK